MENDTSLDAEEFRLSKGLGVSKESKLGNEFVVMFILSQILHFQTPTLLSLPSRSYMESSIFWQSA